MMDQFDPNVRPEHVPASPEGAPAPIVIVQRGRSTWGREFLLLLLLLASAAYIVYQEYRTPWFLGRDEPRPNARIVDARPVAPIVEGSFQLRAEGSKERAEEPVESDPGTLLEVPAEPDAPEAPDPSIEDSGPKTLPEEEELAADVPDAVDPGAPGRDVKPVDDPARAEANPLGSNRASATIVWDLDRLNGPPPLPSDRVAREEDHAPARRPAVVDEPRPREPDPPTLAQRRYFLQCLALTIRQYGLRAGPQIDGLCRDFLAEVPSEVRQLEQRFGPEALVGGSDLDWTITRLRRMGAPEPYLLDRISDRMHRTIGVRHGPRDRMEARVFAARKLLEIPLEVPDVARQ